MGMGKRKLVRIAAVLAVLSGVVLAPAAFAQDEGPTTAEMGLFTANNTWMLTATFLVFTMHLGFATLESGLTRAKNTVNILFKNTGIIAIGILTYALCGFNFMYPGDFAAIPNWLGFAGIGLDPGEGYVPIEYYGGAYPYWTDFMFQAMFAATAATIVSGAVAERIKLLPFLIFSTIFLSTVYPIAGSWKWGGGWLDQQGFYDFAGSTLVHSVGGWAALAGVLMLGPRLGKYTSGGIRAIEGHSMPLATIGVFLLWLGWFGFNGGSVLSGDPELVSYVFTTTALAASAGVIGAMATTWIVQRKPDLSMALNGALAGLVGITAGADSVAVLSSVVIGAICGTVVVLSVLGLDRLKIDDPVGAISVHLTCGILGTVFAGLFATPAALEAWELSRGQSVGIQLMGVAIYGVFAFVGALIIFAALKFTIGIRVPEDEELRGLDIGEHGMEAYGGFQIWTTR